MTKLTRERLRREDLEGRAGRVSFRVALPSHVERGELGWRITDARHLVGRITWDPDRAGEVPLLVIDGRPFTWNQVGRMLMSFEGFTLRVFVSDSIEVIGGPLLEKEEEA